MSWAQKINNKIYFAGLALNIGVAWFFSDGDFRTFTWLMVMLLTTVFSHYFNIKGMLQLIGQRIQGKRTLGHWQMLGHFGLKLILLIIGLVCLMVFIPNKVLQGLILYIFQLIILVLSIKNIGKFYKKGSSS